MKARSAFEERLISHSSESTLKSAKQLLKNNCVTGAFRDMHGVLHGVFAEKNRGEKHVHLELGSSVKAQCDCAEAAAGNSEELCMHAIALWMYSGLFRVPDRLGCDVDTEAASYTGLKNAGLEALAKECSSTAQSAAAAEVVINVESAFPHVPSKWENAVLSVKLRFGKKEYLGNLNNLRQLFFDKVLAVQLKFNDFSLRDRQIIRFLAINGEAENSNILLNSELTCELFHSLGDFRNFFRNGRRVIIHSDQAAEAVVLVRSAAGGREYSPGIVYRGAVLEIHSAKVITGKAGCWVGKNGEYFFLNGDCEVGFVRNFFRLGKWSDAMAGCREFIKNMPFKLIKVNEQTLSTRPASVVLNGSWTGSRLELALNFVYDNLSFAPDGGRLAVDKSNQFFLRQELMEAEMVNNLKMLKISGDIASGRFAVDSTGSAGLFLNDLLPDWIKRYKTLALGGALAKLANGGNGLANIELVCEYSGEVSERGNYLISYAWQESSGGSAAWSDVVAAASAGNRFMLTDNGRLVMLKGNEDIVKLDKLAQALNEEKKQFELPAVAIHYFQHLVRHWRGAQNGVNGLLAGSSNIVPGADSSRKFEFHAQLRSYQQQGVDYMRKMLVNDFNVILADEMGLGKTVQALAVFNELRMFSTAPSLVICPASLVENWLRECGRFLPDCKVGLLYGSNRKEIAQAPDKFDLIITSYTMARREAAKLGKCNFNLLILDEAQHIKNPGTANAHSCKALKARHKLVLTGTPLENSPEDLWSIFDFLHPELLGSFGAFKKEYANIGESEALRRDLAARTAPFIKRRMKKEVAPELPPREEVNLFCRMEEDQQLLYDQIIAEGRTMLAQLENSPQKRSQGNMQILTTLLRLRQVCCHPRLLDKNLVTASGKFELMKELLWEHIDSGHKVLIFSQFTSLLSLIKEYLDSANIKYSYLDGATRNRQDVVDEFNNDPAIGVFLLSLKAGGTGLNLTSADTVMIYDPWWNPAAELQAADRTHRIGQTRSVRTIKLLVKDSIEEKILALQERKREIFDQVVDNPAVSAEKLTIEDLKFLLN
ncbi:MAG: DEAD/DEAH box helicase [Lentisphaeria bacterium]|nr:DEAD/DEAH box helicase [Lentisphaeria bacterium]